MSIKEWLHDVRFRFRHKGSDVHAVISDAEYLTFQKNERTIKQLRWDDIQEIQAEKKDGITIELIYVVFQTASEMSTMEELDQGFQAVLSEMEKRFPAMNRNWYGELNGGKPFEHRRVEIWKKAT